MKFSPSNLSSAAARIAAVGFIAGASAACSSDTLRFGEAPFSNPFSTASSYDQNATGSIQQQPEPVGSGAPLAPIRGSSLAAPQGVASAPIAAPVAVTPRPVVTAQAPVATGGRAGWSGQGGTPVTLAQGETVATLADRYGVPTSAILAANGLTSASQAQPGQRLTIPVYNTAGSASPVPAAAPVRAAAAPHLATPSKVEAKSAMTVRPGAPGPALAAAKTVAPAKVAEAKPAPAAKVEAPKAVVVAKPAQVAVAAPVAAPVASAPAKVAAAPVATPVSADAADQTASIAKDGTDFRWPARGRVIAGFNGKGGNEGINISLPEGTPVKAAEGGTVAYAGSELKGYGNLVLIRHDNGFVSAYAHNGEIDVKRGEKVKRGQIIAKSGQTGNVSTPQLHFELRKGSTPVDPIQHLTGL